jgi:hypothetical protein
MWYFANGDTNKPLINNAVNTFVGSNMAISKVPFSTGTIYRVKIEVNMATNRYTATITDVANPAVTDTIRDLKFRVTGAVANTFFWGFSKSGNETRASRIDQIRVTQGLADYDAYTDWASATGTFPTGATAADTLRTNDYDKDGRANFVEFALDGNPSSGASSGKVVSSIQVVSATNQNHQTITLPVRVGAIFGADPVVPQQRSSQVINFTKYTIEGSYDLVNFNAPVVEVTPAIVPASMPALSSTSGWAYRTFRLSDPVASHPKGFLRVKITGSAP